MFLVSMMVMIIFLLLMTIIFIIPILNMHNPYDREKMSPFECGFDPLSKSRISFSIHFFSVMLMFLIFDIEITIILPIPMIKFMILNMSWMIMISLTMMILIIGLILEWKEGSMNWK